MRIAFAGTAPFAADILRELLAASDHHEALRPEIVISQPDRPAGRGRSLAAPPVKVTAEEHQIDVVQPDRADDPELTAVLRKRSIDVVIVVAYGQIIREPMLSEFMMLNVHASLLPAWRGAAPVERSIMAGDKQTGVCIMRMDAGLDTGPVAASAVIDIGSDDTAGDLFTSMVREGAPLLRDVVHRIADGNVTFHEQPAEGATYAHKIVAADRMLNVDEPAKTVHDCVRALSPHIGAWCEVDGRRTTLWRTRVDESRAQLKAGTLELDDGRCFVHCGSEAIELLDVQPAGKRRMSVDDWLRGMQSPPSIVATALPAQ